MISLAGRGQASPRLKYAIVDTGPLIRGARLETIADTIYTTADVLEEVKDRKTRDWLETLPVELVVREPAPDAIRAGAKTLFFFSFTHHE